MQIQHQKGMPPTIPKDPINDHMTYSVTKKYHSILCLEATAKKPGSTFCHRRPPQFAFWKCEPTHYPQNVLLDTCKY